MLTKSESTAKLSEPIIKVILTSAKSATFSGPSIKAGKKNKTFYLQED